MGGSSDRGGVAAADALGGGLTGTGVAAERRLAGDATAAAYGFAAAVCGGVVVMVVSGRQPAAAAGARCEEQCPRCDALHGHGGVWAEARCRSREANGVYAGASAANSGTRAPHGTGRDGRFGASRGTVRLRCCRAQVQSVEPLWAREDGHSCASSRLCQCSRQRCLLSGSRCYGVRQRRLGTGLHR